jgi:hypothetical protein
MKSTEGYIFKYAGAPISWSSRQQSIVATSSTTAEFCAYDSAVKEALWMKKLLVAMGMIQQDEAIPIYTNSENAITIVKKDGYNGTTKWLDLHYFFVKEAYKRKNITLKKIDGDQNPADGLTKPLTNKKFREFVKMISSGSNK